MPAKRSAQMVIDLLKRECVVEFDSISKALGNPSVQTVFRHLKGVPYRCSYDHKGRFYALHLEDRYDQFGLWSHQGIHFSVDGSLKRTAMRMVREALNGATHKELQSRLQVRVHNTLLDLTKRGDIRRTEHGGHFVYLHSDPEVSEAQLARRKEMLAEQALSDEVSDKMVIEVLLVLIRYPGSRAGEVARRLKGHSPPITMKHVQVVFDRYDLDAVGEKGGPSRR